MLTIEQLVVAGDTAAVRATFRGTHRGAFQGIPPTGRAATMAVANFLRIRDGKIAENRPIFDALSLLQQLGVVPAPQTAPSPGS